MDSLKKLNIQENDLEINGNLNLKLNPIKTGI